MIRYTEIKNRKNHTLRAMLNLPDGISHPPVVLNLHGFGGSLSGYKYAHTHLARVLEAKGIACLRFDFYGCGESDGEFEEMTFTGLLEDTQDVYEWLKEQDFVDTDKIILSGQSMGGFVAYIRAVILRDTGATISPFHSFIFLQGLETLSLRVERHVSNALKIVEYLANHPQVEAVHHPSLETESTHELYKRYLPNGGGSIFTFEIKGDAQTAQAFIDQLSIFSLLANVADVKSLVIHPATTTHSQCTEEELLDQGIKPNTIRLSIGIEKVEDLIEDLDAAFKGVK